MQHTYYFYLSTFVKKKWYFYSVTVRYIQLATFIFFICYSVHNGLFGFVLSETSTKALSQDSFSAIKRSHSQRLTLFHQSNGARRSHDRIQALRGLVQKRASVWLKAVNNGGNNGVRFWIRKGRTPLASHSVCLPYRARKRTAMSCAVKRVRRNSLTYQPTWTPLRTWENMLR